MDLLEFPRIIDDLRNEASKAFKHEPIQSGFSRWFFPEKETLFVESVDRELIKRLCEIVCTACVKPLIELKGTPKTGHCGHLFCASCSDELEEAYRAHFKRTVGKVPQLTIAAINEAIKNSPNTANLHLLYKCGDCCLETVRIPIRECRNNFELFLENKMLKKLYEALKCSETEVGHRCTFHNEDNESCNQLHPTDNVVSQRTADTALNHVKHGCVWHAKTTDHHKLMLANKRDPDVVRDGRLSSIDRNQRRIFSCFYHCAFCSTLLQNDMEDSPSRLPVHLECGHLIGPRCISKVLDKPRTKKSGIYCIFCGTHHKMVEEDDPGYLGSDSHLITPSTQLFPLLNLDTLTCALRCKLPHPVANIDNNTNNKGCRWCTLEEEENKMGIRETIRYYLWKFSPSKLINGFTSFFQRGTVAPAQIFNAIEVP